jgi:hypothetical protein
VAKKTTKKQRAQAFAFDQMLALDNAHSLLNALRGRDMYHIKLWLDLLQKNIQKMNDNDPRKDA